MIELAAMWCVLTTMPERPDHVCNKFKTDRSPPQAPPLAVEADALAQLSTVGQLTSFPNRRAAKCDENNAVFWCNKAPKGCEWLVLKHFAALRKAGLTHPLMDRDRDTVRGRG